MGYRDSVDPKPYGGQAMATLNRITGREDLREGNSGPWARIDGSPCWCVDCENRGQRYSAAENGNRGPSAEGRRRLDRLYKKNPKLALSYR